MKKLVSYISGFAVLLILFSFSFNSNGSKDNAKLNVSVSETCASGTCIVDPDNVCERYSEWEIGYCNTNSLNPCDDNTTIKRN